MSGAFKGMFKKIGTVGQKPVKQLQERMGLKNLTSEQQRELEQKMNMEPNGVHTKLLKYF